MRTVHLLFVLGAVGTAAACSGDDEGRTPLPADVDDVLERTCRPCHSDPPGFDAPMPLITWEHMHRGAPSDGTPVYMKLSVRIDDTVDPMPPTDTFELIDSDRATLQRWVAEGAPPAPME